MLGRLFKRSKHTGTSREEAVAAFLLAQFLPEYHWSMAKEEFDGAVDTAGPEFQKPMRMWILIYCAWLFRNAIVHRYNEKFQREVMTALRVRLARLDPADCGPLIDLPRLLEFWFSKFDSAAIQAMQQRPNPEDRDAHLLFCIAIALVALDEGSPWHMKQDAPHASILNVGVALAKVHERMLPKMLAAVDMVTKSAGGGFSPVAM